MSPKFLLKPLRQCLPEGVFLEKTRNLLALFDSVSSSTEMQRKLKSIERALLDVANRVCEEDVEVHIFGSRLTGLAEWKNDVDVYLQIGEE